MKSLRLCLAATVFVFFVTSPSSRSDETIVTRLNADETRIDVISQIQNEAGDWISETNGYVQLATGQNHWVPETKSWDESVAEIQLGKTGALALTTQQKVYFAPTHNDPQGAVQILTSDGRMLRSSVLALCYFDPLASHRSPRLHATLSICSGFKGIGGKAV